MRERTSSLEHRRLVGLDDGLPRRLDRGPPRGQGLGHARLGPPGPRRAFPDLGGRREQGLVEPRAHQEPLARQELLRLDEDVLAHADLPEVVEDGGVPELAQLLAGYAEAGVRPLRRAVRGLGQRPGQERHALGVARGRRVALLDGRDRGVHEALEEGADRLGQAPVLDRDGRLRGEGSRDLGVGVLEGHDRGPDERGRRPVRHREALAVQELEDADRAAVRRAHGDGEHRACPVAVPLVEARVEAVGGAGGDRAHVREIDDRSRARDEARDRGVVQRQRRGLEVEAHRVVLCALEAQRLAGRGRLDQVQAAGLRERQRPGAGQDRLEQRVMIGLRRERDADLDQGLGLARARLQRPPVSRPRTRSSRTRYTERTARARCSGAAPAGSEKRNRAAQNGSISPELSRGDEADRGPPPRRGPAGGGTASAPARGRRPPARIPTSSAPSVQASARNGTCGRPRPARRAASSARQRPVEEDATHRRAVCRSRETGARPAPRAAPGLIPGRRSAPRRSRGRGPAGHGRPPCATSSAASAPEANAFRPSSPSGNRM